MDRIIQNPVGNISEYIHERLNDHTKCKEQKSSENALVFVSKCNLTMFFVYQYTTEIYHVGASSTTCWQYFKKYLCLEIRE